MWGGGRGLKPINDHVSGNHDHRFIFRHVSFSPLIDLAIRGCNYDANTTNHFIPFLAYGWAHDFRDAKICAEVLANT